MLFWRLSDPMRLPFTSSGVTGSPTDCSDSVSVPRDGIDSLDSDRSDDNASKVASLSKLRLSGSASSGGLNSRPQDRGLDAEIVRLEISFLSLSFLAIPARSDSLHQFSSKPGR